MRTFIYNIGYFLMEGFKTVRFNFLSNVFSVIGTGLILFLLGLVYIGSFLGDYLVNRLSEEAEISVYYNQELEGDELISLMDRMKSIDGVWKVTLIQEEEAHARMEKILGEEAEILSLFEENPFESFIETRIELEQMDSVIDEMNYIVGVEYLRDNRSVLEQIQDISKGIEMVGFLILAAVAITTIVIISHMIRQGIFENREQINTLGLLGAPRSFIGFPFVLVGVILTLCGGGIAVLCLHFIIPSGLEGLSNMMPFIPIPSIESVMEEVITLILVISGILGFIGSLFGLSSIRKGMK